LSEPPRPKKPKSKSILHTLLSRSLPLESETARFILVNVLDIFMTWFLLWKWSGKFTESNPIADYFIDHWGIRGMVYFKMGMVAFIVVLSQIIAGKKPESARWLLNFTTLVVAGVVIYSFVLLIRVAGVF